jgi:hypothetical protein
VSIALTSTSETTVPPARRSLAIVLAIALLPLPLAAQSAATPATRPAPCSTAEHRQFDFWIGEWDVTRPDGRTAGTNRIRAVHGGCALQEEWSGAGGSTGTSINAYDATARRWHQTWIGNDGVLLHLDGAAKDGAMELAGATAGANGARTLQRIRWTPLAGTPARIRQLWESSTDGGRTWTVVFDGLYKRRGAGSGR